jgi:hypothetical protein
MRSDSAFAESRTVVLAQKFLPIFCGAGSAHLPEHSYKVLLGFEALFHLHYDQRQVVPLSLATGEPGYSVQNMFDEQAIRSCAGKNAVGPGRATAIGATSLRA